MLASVRFRITVVATVALAAGLTIGAIGLVHLLRSALLDAQTGSGPARAAELAALAGRGPLPAELPSIGAGRLTLEQVINSNGEVIAASPELVGQPALLPAAERHWEMRDDIAGLGAGPWLVEPSPATLGGRPSVVIVVTSLSDYERSAELLATSFAVGLPILMLLVASVIWFVVGRSLRPVESLRSQLAQISSERLDRRVPAPAGRDEIGRLARTLNEMLDRLETSASAQQRFVADASHELRTPIANIRAAVEVAAAHPDIADWHQVADDVLEQGQRMERLTDDLLVLARTGGSVPPMRIELVALAQLVAAELRGPAPVNVRLVSVAIADATVAGDRQQLATVLSNLIGNAVRHARSRVTIAVTAGSTWVELRVGDDGPGIAHDDRESAFEPFVRLDQHRDRHDGGAGLGLAIARQIVKAHHGSIRVTDNEPGALFIVRLPLSGSSQALLPTVEP
jgi:signal transduction histidine kinase